MKKIIYLVGCIVLSSYLFSCAGDGEDIGEPLVISEDYELPQSGASASANQRIVNYYEKYGSFILYNFTNEDAMWVMETGVASSGGREYYTTLGDPANVDAMLDYIEEIWLNYFPEDFLRKGGLPYRVFLADSVYMQRDYGGGQIYKYPSNYLIKGDALIIAGMNSVKDMSEYEKTTRKAELFNAMWDYYKSKGLVTDPEAFYAETDYVTKPQMSYALNDYGYYSWIYTEEDLAALRNRGFIPKYSAYGYSVYNEIYNKYSETSDSWSYSTTEAIKANDYSYYFSQIMKASDETVDEFLKYPAVAKKWNCLIDYYKETIGIDLRAMSK